MRYAFKGEFIQATAETAEENLALMALKGQATQKSSRPGVNAKVWETRRERYGAKGTKPRAFIGPDGKKYKNKGAYNKHVSAVIRWNATPIERREAIVRRLKESRKKNLVGPGGVPTSWLE